MLERSITVYSLKVKKETWLLMVGGTDFYPQHLGSKSYQVSVGLGHPDRSPYQEIYFKSFILLLSITKLLKMLSKIIFRIHEIGVYKI